MTCEPLPASKLEEPSGNTQFVIARPVPTGMNSPTRNESDLPIFESMYILYYIILNYVILYCIILYYIITTPKLASGVD
jgi:hypothetical protein